MYDSWSLIVSCIQTIQSKQKMRERFSENWATSEMESMSVYEYAKLQKLTKNNLRFIITYNFKFFVIVIMLIINYLRSHTRAHTSFQFTCLFFFFNWLERFDVLVFFCGYFHAYQKWLDARNTMMIMMISVYFAYAIYNCTLAPSVLCYAT